MSLLTVVVPAYNAEKELNRCVDSLLVGGPTVEIIIVDDGSIDHTGEIADEYAAQNRNVQVIHQVNGGHGAAINSGLAQATGTYFKVVDSDDWLAPVAFKQWLSELAASPLIDLALTNYVYDKAKHNQRPMRFRREVPQHEIFGWERVKLRVGKYFLMHSVTYRTQLLREVKLNLPAHTYYEDSLFVFEPLIAVHTIRYWDLDLYQYVIGRAGQSVNEKVMFGRIDQQLAINHRLMQDYQAMQAQVEPALRRYLAHYVAIITGISSVLLLHDGSQISLSRKQALWQNMKHQEPQLYHRVRHSLIGRSVNLPGPVGRLTTVGCYKVLRHVYKFN